MNALRHLRRDADLSQRDFARLLDVPLNSFRMWDSGLRPLPAHMLLRARATVARHAQQSERLPLRELAQEFQVHVRTLQTAVRTGRLAAHFSVKSVFGRPRRLATRAATAPHNFPHLLRVLRRRLRLTQGGLAKRIGAAGNASSISGSRGSERRRRSFGNACCDWNTALHAGPGCVLKLQCHRL